MERRTLLTLTRRIMLEFATVTGISAAGESPRRYLWTDAFAVCNFLGLHARTGEERFKQLAVDLIAQVHGTLGRHRMDDPRNGWISGLDDREGALHPTQSGLRIGKTVNERQQGEPLDERREWDRDGQYYHYLTKWMHALHLAGRTTGEPAYDGWAVELAKAAHAGFVYTPYTGGRKQMFWKMSIDLSRPLVASMGHHDPLDGLITCTELQAAARSGRQMAKRANLKREIADLASMCKGMNWTTDDPLGLGGLLSDACRVGMLMGQGCFESGALIEDMLQASLTGLDSFIQKSPFSLPAGYRLAFRELGLSIGLKAIGKLRSVVEENPGPFGNAGHLRTVIDALMRYGRLIETIEGFWLERANQETEAWAEHRDINSVMLATSLMPDGFLSL